VEPGVQPGGAAAQAGPVNEICHSISCELLCDRFVSSKHEGRTNACTKESTKESREENLSMQQSKMECEAHKLSIG
jgi:hypothetical protein